MKKKIAVLISGNGSNMIALHNATLEEEYPAEIVVVVSDKKLAKGIEKAKEKKLKCEIINSEKELDDVLGNAQVEYICLAGFMRILSEEFVKKWEGKILNIHPSLLPQFIGLNTHERALEAKVKEHGCTVHFVTSELDQGPIIAQGKVEVKNDDVTTLAGRVLEMEHQIYSIALGLVVRQEVVFGNEWEPVVLG